MIPEEISLLDYLRALAESDARHAATCPYCQEDRLAELMRGHMDDEARAARVVPIERRAA